MFRAQADSFAMRLVDVDDRTDRMIVFTLSERKYLWLGQKVALGTSPKRAGGLGGPALTLEEWGRDVLEKQMEKAKIPVPPSSVFAKL